MDWMILPLKRYADFSGRSCRREFWIWVLFVILVAILLGVVDSLLGLGGRFGYGDRLAMGPGMMDRSYGAHLHGGVLSHLFLLAIIIPNIAVAVRRLHDTDHSGWWLLITIVPHLLAAMLALAGVLVLGGLIGLLGFVGAVVLLVWYCQPGVRGPNLFGPDPLAPDATAPRAGGPKDFRAGERPSHRPAMENYE